jgi:hypothetical protein
MACGICKDIDIAWDDVHKDGITACTCGSQRQLENFEGHAQQTEGGVEYWLARDIQHLLGHTEWLNTSVSREQLLADLQAWCHRAEASGIAALRDFSLMLRAARV